MLKALLGTVLGAVGALEADRWITERKARLAASGVTGALLDRVNRRLEDNRTDPR